LLAQPFQFRFDEFSTLLRIAVARSAGAQYFELLFQAALQFIAERFLGEAVDHSAFLLLERALVSIRGGDHLQYRRSRRE
jgi:hypothetical protein